SGITDENAATRRAGRWYLVARKPHFVLLVSVVRPSVSRIGRNRGEVKRLRLICHAGAAPGEQSEVIVITRQTLGSRPNIKFQRPDTIVQETCQLSKALCSIEHRIAAYLTTELLVALLAITAAAARRMPA